MRIVFAETEKFEVRERKREINITNSHIFRLRFSELNLGFELYLMCKIS